MKSALTLLLSVLAVFALSANGATYKFVAANDQPGTQLCVSAVKNNLLGYKNMARHYRMSQKIIANNLTCNGMGIATFAASYQADRTAAYINKYRKGQVSITDIAALPVAKDDEQGVIVVMVR